MRLLELERVLIVPSGIETPKYLYKALLEIVLIVPSGIETYLLFG